MDVKRLIAQAMAPLHKRIAELEAEVARLRKNCFNFLQAALQRHHQAAAGDSSGRGGKKRLAIGGQPGHPKHQRREFPPEQIDHTLTYELSALARLVPLNRWRSSSRWSWSRSPL